MKTQFIPVLAACFGLMFASCSQDSIVDNSVSPSYMSQTAGLSLNPSAVSSNIQEFSLYAPSALTKELMSPENGKSLEHKTNQPKQAISGYGGSEVNGSGSWKSDLQVVYNPNADAVSGSITLHFPDYGDYVEFVVYGGPATALSGGHSDLIMKLAIADGSGRFERAKFEGTAVVKSIDMLKSSMTYGELLIQGSLISEGE